MVDRKNFDRKKILQESKENEELMTFVKSISRAEIARIKEIRKFDELKSGSNRYKIALLCDQLRTQYNVHRLKLKKTLNGMVELNNNIDRLKLQLESGNITEEQGKGIIMNANEVRSLINRTSLAIDGEFNVLRFTLADISGLIGHIDYIKNIIITEEEFDKIVEKTSESIFILGYDLFGELNG